VSKISQPSLHHWVILLICWSMRTSFQSARWGPPGIGPLGWGRIRLCRKPKMEWSQATSLHHRPGPHLQTFTDLFIALSRQPRPPQTPSNRSLPAKFGGVPSVGATNFRAYTGPLPITRNGIEGGIEFTTTVAPKKGNGTPHEAMWYLGDPGVLHRQRNQTDYAAIPAVVCNHQP
jgi:hypothetical protein